MSITISMQLLAQPIASAPTPGQTLARDTLVSWTLTASIGAYMLTRWLASGGLRRHRETGGGLPPGVIFAHFGLALSGLLVWAAYVATALPALAWVAIGLLMPAIGFGLSTVTLWTPYPVRAPGDPLPGSPEDKGSATGMFAAPADDAVTGKVSDAMLTGALTDDVLLGRLVDDVLARVPADPSPAPPRPKGPLAALIPFGHGIGALTTFLLAVLAAVGMS
ncbi:MAG: hypothetical protein ACLPUO_17630 [Streptosporangiaceae bacterium]